MSELIVVLCTCPDFSKARDIAYQVVKMKLVACANIVPTVMSIYSWEDKVQQDEECQLVLKTRQSVLSDLQRAVFDMHPYDVPEWLVLPVSQASTDYADWIKSVVK